MISLTEIKYIIHEATRNFAQVNNAGNLHFLFKHCIDFTHCSLTASNFKKCIIIIALMNGSSKLTLFSHASVTVRVVAKIKELWL